MPRVAKPKSTKIKQQKTNKTQRKTKTTKITKPKNKVTKKNTDRKTTEEKTNKKVEPKFEKLHVKTWALTTGIILGGYLFLAVIMEIYYIETFLFSEKYYKLLVSIYPGITTCLKGAFIAFFYGLLSGGIFGGLFASLHNYIRKFFK